jgi:hypothetical protein
MLLTYERFGALVLPQYDPSEPIGAFGSRSSYLDLPASGSYRGYGDEQSPQGTRIIRRAGTILGSSLDEVDVAFAELCAARGTAQRLYGRRPDGRVVWTMAELSSVEALREPRALFRGCPEVALVVDTEFVLYDPPWRGSAHGDGWRFDDGEYFDSGLVFDEQVDDVYALFASGDNGVHLLNAGNATTRDAVLVIVAGPQPITGVTITSTSPAGAAQADIIYSGTFGANKTLRIDCGRQAIEHDTSGVWVGDYEHLAFGPNHTIAGWLDLDPGTTELIVRLTTTWDATFKAYFSDGWA